MAAIETIKDGTSFEEIINVGQKVGNGGYPNVVDDVMVVQALLNYIREVYNFAPSEPALGSPASGLPEPYLSKIIKAFQRHHNGLSGMRAKVTVDGVVGRAKGNVGWMPGRMWTIVALNYQCEVFFLARHDKRGDTMINDVLARNPMLNPMLRFGGVLQF